MPIYEYTCAACGNRTDILHGINDPPPPFCPECGAEGTLRKGFAPPAIVFKGSGWAKKDRSAASSGKSRSAEADTAGGGKTGEGDGADKAGDKGADKGGDKAASKPADKTAAEPKASRSSDASRASSGTDGS